jgi:hypothetical protein
MGVALQVDDRVGHGSNMQKDEGRMKKEISGGWLTATANTFRSRSDEGN